MAIINDYRKTKKDKLRVGIDSEILADIQSYCQWAGINDIADFIEESANFVFKKDKDWGQYEKLIKQTRKNKMTA